MNRFSLVLVLGAVLLAIPLVGCRGGKTEGGGDAANSQDYNGAPPGADSKPSTTPPQSEDGSPVIGAPTSEN
ncbi:MAG: hypothetical protein KF812_03720 [Fimbriimonadaceae bacterium]|nr:hypothetical protein [Fimbriimonadaceae bacterium]